MNLSEYLRVCWQGRSKGTLSSTVAVLVTNALQEAKVFHVILKDCNLLSIHFDSVQPTIPNLKAQQWVFFQHKKNVYKIKHVQNILALQYAGTFTVRLLMQSKKRKRNLTYAVCMHRKQVTPPAKKCISVLSIPSLKCICEVFNFKHYESCNGKCHYKMKKIKQ